jgi:four helix bundle protein
MPEMLIRTFRDLTIHQRAHAIAMEVFEISKRFPSEEKFSLIDQVRRSSRSVAVNIAEAWGKRRYPASFVSKLTDSEAEALETQAWLMFAIDCKYLQEVGGRQLIDQYEELVRSIANVANHPKDWCFPKQL